MRHLLPFLVVFLLVAVLLRLDFAFYGVYVLGGLWVLARIGYRRSLERLTWERCGPSHAFLGDRPAVDIVVANRTRLPLPWLRLADTVPPALFGAAEARQVITLAGRERYRFRYHLDCRRRGYYTLGPLQIDGGDPLGLLEMNRQGQDVAHLTVYPRIVPLGGVALESRQPLAGLPTRRPIFEDPARLAGVRPYRSGDSIRRIHWKLSAHVGELQVKKVQPAIGLASVILLNLNRDEYHPRTWDGVSEWGITLAATLAYYLGRAGQAVGLRVHGLDPLHEGRPPQPLPPRAGSAHLMQVLEILARVAAAPLPSFAAWLTTATTDLPWGVNLLVISPHAEATLLAALHQQHRRGFEVVLFAVEPYQHFAVVQGRARQLGLSAYNLAREYELRQWSQQAGILTHVAHRFQR
ncbi:MAG: DUF58 domain-containing protein [Anaerolineae bacterium]|nr:DUF58 domain-containing protein [Caldilineales bacterium]MCX7853527.1 DUF58 domain-containing protein [Caldilineales bacterium]MDW8269024.1 DUF58 domain-containing protein [Anaerolineae bacterium]